MGFHYLKDKDSKEKTWAQITRDERTFCSFLFHQIGKEPKKFIKFLNDLKSPLSEYRHENRINLDPQEKWEAGFEVCFYRDVLKAKGEGVRSTKMDANVNGVDHSNNLIKRTFDLCLFSNTTMVIIEAKASEPLTSKQFQDFSAEKKLLNRLFKYLRVKSPKLVFLILAAQAYYDSPSFQLEKGVGRKNILNKTSQVDGVFSWEQVHAEFYDNPIIKRASEVYGSGN